MNSTVQDFDKVMGTNVRPLWMIVHRAVPHLIKTKGKIRKIGIQFQSGHLERSYKNQVNDFFSMDFLTRKGLKATFGE